MLTDQEFSEFVEDMTVENISKKAAMLRAISKLPSADKRVTLYLERLLHDTTPCLLGIPYIFGEIRWLAAKALAAEREALAIRETVRLQNVVRPLNTMGIMRAADAANVRVRGGVEGLLETLGKLQEMDKLPLYDLYLPPLCLRHYRSMSRRKREHNRYWLLRYKGAASWPKTV
jgi:hypothetical protein